jgi:hypothetical protein
MPSFTHHKHHSFPPFRTTTHPSTPLSSTPRSTSRTRIPLQKEDPGSENSIDTNPFSFFISPAPSESDDTDSEDEDYIYGSAGISISNSPPRSRSLPPSSLRRNESSSEISFYDEQSQTPRPRSPKSVLNRFIEKHVQSYHTDTEEGDAGGPLTRSKSFSSSLSMMGSGSGSAAARGRPGYDLGSASFGRHSPPIYSDFSRGRIITRSHSPKPRSWREPSPALWPVFEDVDREAVEEDEKYEGSRQVPVKRKFRKGSEYLFVQSI